MSICRVLVTHIMGPPGPEQEQVMQQVYTAVQAALVLLAFWLCRCQVHIMCICQGLVGKQELPGALQQRKLNISYGLLENLKKLKRERDHGNSRKCLTSWSWKNRGKMLRLLEHGASLVAQTVKNLPGMWETWIGSLGQEDPPGEGNGNSLQNSCLENLIDRGVWWATVHGVAKS